MTGKQTRVIAVVGPTATGKTALAVALAERLGGEVVSADSRQVYTGLDIGTGKATRAEMRGVPHHLIDICAPEMQYSASDFVRDGRAAISGILERGHVPIIVGGTGMYVDALVGRMALNSALPNAKLRARLDAETTEALVAELAALDPVRARTVDQKNRRRLVRALEAAHAGGVQKTIEPYKVTWIGLTLPREELQERILRRLHDRLVLGMLDEAAKLHSGGLSYERMESLGLEYRYMARHLEGQMSYDEMVERLGVEIYKYAKRQMTWFKKNTDIQWFLPTTPVDDILLATGQGARPKLDIN